MTTPKAIAPEAEIRVVLSQVGAAIELHRPDRDPVTLTLLRPQQIAAYAMRLPVTMRHTSIGQIAIRMAREIAKADVPVSPDVWTFNASTNEYRRT